MFVIRIFKRLNDELIPTNLYVTNNRFYQNFVNSAIVDVGDGSEWLLDSNIDDGKDGILILNGNQVFYRSKSKTANIPVKTYVAAVSPFVANKNYAKEDLVIHDDMVFFKNEAGPEAVWDRDNWTKVLSGHLLETLTYYDEPTFVGETHLLREGVMFYGDEFQYAVKAFRPGEEHLAKFVRDVNNDKFEFFHSKFVVHKNTIFYQAL